MGSRCPFSESWIDLTSSAASSRHLSICRTVTRQIDSISRPSIEKRLSQVVSVHEGGHEPVDCQDISCDDALVVESDLVGVSIFGSITIGCGFEAWILSVDFLVFSDSLLLVLDATDRCTSPSMWKGTRVLLLAGIALFLLMPTESSPTSVIHRWPAAQKGVMITSLSEMVKIAVKARDTTDAACILLTVEVSLRNDGRGKAGYISSVSFEKVGSYFFNS